MFYSFSFIIPVIYTLQFIFAPSFFFCLNVWLEIPTALTVRLNEENLLSSVVTELLLLGSEGFLE
jgi:hypothetical protein